MRQEIPKQRKGLTAIDGAMALIVLLLVVQVWLLSASLDAYLSGRTGAALPGAIVSGLLFTLCFGLYVLVNRIDREARR